MKIQAHPLQKSGDPLFLYPVVDVLDVYDGDTCTVLLDLGFGLYKQGKVRIVGVDTPEVRGWQKQAGFIVRDMVTLVLDECPGPIHYHSHKDRDKYGRMLGDLHNGDFWLSEWLVKSGYALPYGGGKRDTEGMEKLVETLVQHRPAAA